MIRENSIRLWNLWLRNELTTWLWACTAEVSQCAIAQTWKSNTGLVSRIDLPSSCNRRLRGADSIGSYESPVGLYAIYSWGPKGLPQWTPLAPHFRSPPPTQGLMLGATKSLLGGQFRSTLTTRQAYLPTYIERHRFYEHQEIIPSETCLCRVARQLRIIISIVP